MVNQNLEKCNELADFSENGFLAAKLDLCFQSQIRIQRPKLSLSTNFIIQIRQLIGFFKIYGRHIGSAITKFRILTSNSYSATQITP